MHSDPSSPRGAKSRWRGTFEPLDPLSVAGLSAFAGGGFLLAAMVSAHRPALVLATVGVSLLAAGIVHAIYSICQHVSAKLTLKRLSSLIEEDAAPGFITDADGTVLCSNAAARQRCNEEGTAQDGGQLGFILRDVFANPPSVLRRLQAVAKKEKKAVEDLVTRGGLLRLSVHLAPKNTFLWRLEDIATAGNRDRRASGVPMLTVGRGNVVLYVNDAARDFFGDRPRSLEVVFPDLPVQNSAFNLVLGADGLRNCLVQEVSQDLNRSGRREVFFMPVSGDVVLNPAGSTALDTLPVALLKLDRNAHILEANQRGLELLGRTISAAPTPQGNLGRLGEYLDGPGRALSDWVRDTFDNHLETGPERLALKGGADRFVQVTLTRVEEAAGRHLVAVLSDATQWQRLEAQFEQSQKMQAIGELAGGIAHDFNNLLTAISGHCDLLLRGHDRNDADYADLIQISQNANRAAALVGQLLAFSRKQRLRPEAVEIADTLSEMTHLLKRLVGEKISVDLDIRSGLGLIKADRQQLEQVLMNLVVNARDAMKGRGTIQIVTANEHLEAPLSRDRAKVPAGRYVTIRVSDKGPGIPDALRHKIFEPFFTTKRPGEGTGLGLSMVYGIVKQSGGYVFIDSEMDKGSCFTLMFPAFEGTAPSVPAEERADAPIYAGNGVVLLVEDEAPVRAFAARALRLSGLTVLEAASAEEALEILEDKSLTFDVFLTDVIMPGMDGPTWVERARKRHKDTKVVFMSGYTEDAFDRASIEAEEAQFLAKPFSLNQLTEVVRAQFPPPSSLQ